MSENAYKRFLWYGIAALLVFTPAARGTVRIWSIMPVLFVIMLLVFMWLWRLNNREGYGFRRSVLDVPLLLFALLAISSFAFSVYKHDSFYALIRLLGYIGIYYLIVNNFDHGMMRRMIALIICMGTALSVYGLLQYFDILPRPWWHSGKLLSSTYVNHNHFSGYLELVIPLTIGTLLARGRGVLIAKLPLTAALITMVAAFVLAQSRGAWICLAAALLVMSVILVKRGALSGKSVFSALLIMILIVAFIFVARPEVSERLDTITKKEVGEASLQTRIKIWQGTVEMVRQRPWSGTGIGTFAWAFPRFRPEGLNNRAYFTHNDYLHVTAEMGILALAVMAWILAVVIWTGSVKRSFSLDILGCAIGVLSLAFHGVTDFNFHITANMLLCTVYIAFIMGSGYLKEEHQETGR